MSSVNPLSTSQISVRTSAGFDASIKGVGVSTQPVLFSDNVRTGVRDEFDFMGVTTEDGAAWVHSCAAVLRD